MSENKNVGPVATLAYKDFGGSGVEAQRGNQKTHIDQGD